MSRNLEGTTSHRALIVGMTNSDQVAFWQAGPATAEMIPDVEDSPEPGDAGEVNENGLTASEQAEFDSMRTGDAPVADEGPGDEGDEGDDADLEEPAEPAPAVREPGDKEPAVADPAAQKKPPPKTVNYSKYQRELQKANKVAQEATAAAQKEREDRIKLAARVDLINEALQQQARQPAPVAEEPEAVVNPFEEADIDPTEDFAAAVAQVNRRAKFQYENQNQVNQESQMSRADQQLKETFERDFRSYAATEEGKDIPAAYQFLKDSRLTEICITKFDKDPNDPAQVFTPQEVAEMVRIFNAEEKWVVDEAVKARKSPAVAIMKLAKSRGFKPPVVVAQPAAAAPVARVPAARPAAPAPAARPAPGQPDATEQLGQLQRNQDDARSLSDGGGAPPGGLTAEMILRLNDAEFAEMVDSMSQHQLDALMGRSLPGA